MRTDELIRALAADAGTTRAGTGRSLMVALPIGAAASAVLFAAALGVRPDALASLASYRYVLKFVITLLLAATALRVVWQLSQPGRRVDTVLLAVAPLLLVVAAASELVVLPSNAWSGALFGTTWVWCLVWVPLLSLAPLAATLLALRRAAPTAPRFAGAVGGLLAGGIGATFYASHCPGDSPLFLIAWYSIGIALIAVLGALAGGRMLRW